MLSPRARSSRLTSFARAEGVAIGVAHARNLGARTGLPMLRGSYDEFGDPIQVTIGGNVVEPRSSLFPELLDTPGLSAPATITPYADVGSIMYRSTDSNPTTHLTHNPPVLSSLPWSRFAPLQQSDAIAACFLGIALLLGPDFILAPAGLVSDRGIRHGYALESVVGSVLDADAQWLRDRNEGLQADAPILVRAPILVLFLTLGLLVDRLLIVALEDSGFVISSGICSCIGAGLLEVIREPLPTRAERDLQRRLSDEFFVFSSEKLTSGGTCHEREIIRSFRSFYPRYRYEDMERSADGVSVADKDIVGCIRKWNMQMGRPAERTSAGYWKGISIASRELERAPRSES
jgi:hypothetical protein